MEKVPSSSPEFSEEPKPQPERSPLTTKEQDDLDFRDQLQSFFERASEKELADTVMAASKEREVGVAQEKTPDAIELVKDADDSVAREQSPTPKKKRSRDVLSGARPNVRERLMKVGTRGTATLAERGVIMFGGKGMDIYEQMSGYPSLKRERAQKEADEISRALDTNREMQQQCVGDQKLLQTLRSEEERLETQSTEARRELGKRKTQDEKFQSRKRSFESKMRHYAAGVLKDIDAQLVPYEREHDAVRVTIERFGGRIALIRRRLGAYEEKLAQQRVAARSESDPLKRKSLEAEITRIQSMVNSRRPAISRVIKRKGYVEKRLGKNESVTLPLRQQQRRFARAASLEVHQGVVAKGSPPEDLPVMPRGGSRAKEGGKERQKEHEAGLTPIDTFISQWNGAAGSGWRIDNAKYFKYLVGNDQKLAPEQAEHIAHKYFQDQALRNGIFLSPRQYRKVEKLARAAAVKAFPW